MYRFSLFYQKDVEVFPSKSPGIYQSKHRFLPSKTLGFINKKHRDVSFKNAAMKLWEGRRDYA
jgi:hypothetical protein